MFGEDLPKKHEEERPDASSGGPRSFAELTAFLEALSQETAAPEGPDEEPLSQADVLAAFLGAPGPEEGE
eukprot:1552712-Lingulodinium_polyedra.AAC.1